MDLRPFWKDSLIHSVGSWTDEWMYLQMDGQSTVNRVNG